MLEYNCYDYDKGFCRFDELILKNVIVCQLSKCHKKYINCSAAWPMGILS